MGLTSKKVLLSLTVPFETVWVIIMLLCAGIPSALFYTKADVPVSPFVAGNHLLPLHHPVPRNDEGLITCLVHALLYLTIKPRFSWLPTSDHKHCCF